MQPESNPLRTNVVNDIVYAPISSWEKHTLDLYLPPSPTASRPLVLFVHGGAWRTGDKSGFVDMARRIVDVTHSTVAVVNYTLSIASIKDDPTSVPSKAQHPKHVQDIALAFGFLYQQAQVYQAYSPKKIILVGHSAGGQITGLLALRPDLYLEPVEASLGLAKGTLHAAIRGVVGVQGIYNVDRLLKAWPSYRDFVIQGFGEKPEALIHGSPDRQRAADESFSLPSYAIVHSNQDELVDPAQGQEYFDHLQTLAGPAKGKVVIEFGDWGSHDDMLQTDQFPRTVAKYVELWQ